MRLLPVLALAWATASGLEDSPAAALGNPRFEAFSTSSNKPDPFDGTRPLESRARAYLDINCAYCHQPGGVGKGGMDLRFGTPLERTALFAPSGRAGPDGKPLFHIRPGDIRASDIYIRLASLGKDAMPPLGRTRVDEKGLALMREWIEGLAAESPGPKRTTRTRGPWLIHPRERRELTLDRWNPGAGGISGGISDLEIIHPSGRREEGISFSSRMVAGTGEWTVRFSRPLPRGRYWMVIGGDGVRFLRDLLVM